MKYMREGRGNLPALAGLRASRKLHTRRNSPPRTHYTAGSADPRVGLNGVEKEKNSLLRFGIEPLFPGRPACSLITILSYPR